MCATKSKLLASIAMLGVFLPAFAEVETANYLESFSSSSFNIANYEGWGRITDGNVSYSAVTGKSGYSVGYTGYQNSDKSATPSESATIYYDLLVSPQLKGDVSFYFRRAVWNTAYVSSIQVYECTKNDDGSFSRGDLIKSFDSTTSTATGTSWQTNPLTLSLDDYTYLGFRLEECYIDELSASYAMMPEKQELTFTSVALAEAGQEAYMDETSVVTLHPTVVFTNSGNVEYPAGVSFTITPSFTNGADQAVTVDIPAIPVGESFTYEGSLNFVVPSPDSSAYTNFRLGIKWGSTTNYTGYVKAYPYLAYPVIVHNSATYSGSVIDFETFQGDRSRQIKLKNEGSAPLIVSSVTLPDGVKLTNLTEDKLPITLNTNESVEETITICGDHVGDIAGSVVFNFDDLEHVAYPTSSYTNTFNFKGTVVPADTYFVNFDDQKYPDGWFATDYSQISFTATPSSALYKGYYLKLGGELYAGNDNRRYLQTCKLHFAEGDKLNFSLARNSTTSTFAVAISTDRANWTDLASFTASDCESTTSTVFTKLSVDMPEGEYFIRLYSGNMNLDNFYGGQKVDVAYDIAPVSASYDGALMVNYPLTVEYTFTNLGNTIAEDAYSLSLQKTADTEAVAVEGVGQLGSGSNFTVSVTYTPHEAGDYINHLVITTADDSPTEVAVNDVEFAVAEESLSFENVIAIGNATNANIPFRGNQKYSYSEMILPRATVADDVETPTVFGSMASNDISEIWYYFYNENAARTYHIEIWLQDTDDTAVGSAFHGTDDMTLFYSSDSYQLPKAGSNTNYQPLKFVGDNIFKHDASKNLRIYFVATTETASGWFTTIKNSGQTISGIQYYGSAALSASSKISSDSYMPAMTIVTTGEAAELKGHTIKYYSNVSGSEYLLLPNATVTAYNADNDVIYSTQSDENGEYTLSIYQTGLDYVYSAYHESVVNDNEEPIIVVLETVDFDSDENDFLFSIMSYIKSIVDDNIDNGEEQFYNLNGVKLSRENLVPGIYIRRIGNKVQKVLVK